MREEVLDLGKVAIDPHLAEKVSPDWEQLATCMHCGTCTASCPTAHAMGYAPRQLWHMIHIGLEEEVLHSNTFWLCTVCNMCTARCPRGIKLTDTMLALKEYSIQKGIGVPENMPVMRDTLLEKYNISGDDNSQRLIWSSNLERIPEGVQPKQAEVLYFIGCVSAFYPRVYGIPQAFAQIMERGGVDFSTLGGEEWCCGYPLYVAGIREHVAEMARHNVARMQEMGAKRVIFTCPSCYYAWTHLYGEYIQPNGLVFQHATEFIAEMIEDGKLNLGPVEEVVTYHDPCDLGRKSGIFDAPRYVLNSIPGLEFVEMFASRENSVCCGGGGDVEVSDREVSGQVAARRLAQVEATGASVVLSACQQCKRTLQEGARQNKIRVRAEDIVELVWRSLESAG